MPGSGRGRHRHRLRCTDRLFQQRAHDPVGVGRERAPIDLVHARVERAQHPVGTVHAARALGQGLQAGHRHHRQIGAEGGALDHGGGDAQAGECAGTAAEGQGVEVAQAQTGIGEQSVHHRQDEFAVPPRRDLEALLDRVAQQQRGRTGVLGGVDREQRHHQGTSTVEPVVRRSARSRCACAASDSA
jgi:hypothetical protein